MSTTKIWPHAMIRELLARADINGESRARLSSQREAERFRFAIYNFRRQRNLGSNLCITIEDDSVVVVTRREPPVVTILDTANDEWDWHH